MQAAPLWGDTGDNLSDDFSPENVSKGFGPTYLVATKD
jgi:hypothetical protein